MATDTATVALPTEEEYAAVAEAVSAALRVVDEFSVRLRVLDDYHELEEDEVDRVPTFADVGAAYDFHEALKLEVDTLATWTEGFERMIGNLNHLRYESDARARRRAS